MAKRDTTYKRSRGGRGKSVNWDAHSRQRSKSWHDDIMASGTTPMKVLSSYSDGDLVDAHNAMTNISRYGDYDWNRVTSKLTIEDVEILMERIRNEGQRNREIFECNAKERRERANQELEKQTAELRDGAALSAGMLDSDLYQTFRLRETCDCRDGDWLDDPVAAYIGGNGWGEEQRVRSGVKLQITLSLDMSNSMWNNAIAKPAITLFIHIGLALQELSQRYPDLHTHSFLFAMGQDGDVAHPLSKPRYTNVPEDLSLGDFEEVRSNLSWMPSSAGQDTRIAPLFEQIAKWEMEESDEGAVRLDIILTDGVLEHRNDVWAATEIQEKRDGTLRTILLNFLPEDDWYDIKLPHNCIQYPVDKGNVGGILRLLITEFVGAFI